MNCIQTMKWALFYPPKRFQWKIRVMNRSRSKLIKTLIRNNLARVHACHISYNAKIDDSTFFPHPTGITIGDGVIIEPGCTVYQNVTIGRKEADENGYPIIRCGSTVYAGAAVLGKIEIGPNAVVGANAVVVDFVGSNEIAVGIPARTIPRKKKDE